MVRASRLFEDAVLKLTAAGNDNSRFDANELFALVFGKKYELLDSNSIDEQQAEQFNKLVSRRAEGYPLQYILGEWEFYGITLKVGEGVLIPRQDTESVVEAVIKKNRITQPVIIDLCSGSGAIALALEKELSPSEIYAVELSEDSADYLKQNIALNQSSIKLMVGDCLDVSLADKLPKADIIVSNPPYLTADEMNDLQTEVTYEPGLALFGGEDGLDFYRDITRLYKNRLNHNGMLAFEVGFKQAEEVMEILIQAGLEDVRAYEDYCGIKRAVIGFYTEKHHVKLY